MLNSTSTFFTGAGISNWAVIPDLANSKTKFVNATPDWINLGRSPLARISPSWSGIKKRGRRVLTKVIAWCVLIITCPKKENSCAYYGCLRALALAERSQLSTFERSVVLCCSDSQMGVWLIRNVCFAVFVFQYIAIFVSDRVEFPHSVLL